MKLTDEQIKSIMSKDVASKTILVDKDEMDKIIANHIKDGWTLIKKSEVNNRVKITFQKVK